MVPNVFKPLKFETRETLDKDQGMTLTAIAKHVYVCPFIQLYLLKFAPKSFTSSINSSHIELIKQLSSFCSFSP